MSVCVKHNCYHLLIVEDRLEPLKVLRLEWHQDHECAGLVVRSRVSNGRLGVEEPHGGLVPNVVLVSSHWSIVQPEAQIKYSPQVDLLPPLPTHPTVLCLKTSGVCRHGPAGI